MLETTEQFYSRVFVNFCNNKVFIFPTKKREGKCEVWSIEQAKQYLNYLSQEEVMI